MRKIHRVVRLHFEAGLSIRAIARSIGASPSTMGDDLRRFEVAGLPWPLPEGLDECALEARLFLFAPVATRVERVMLGCHFTELQDFLDIYYQGLNALGGKEDFHGLVLVRLEEAVADGTVPVDVFYDPYGLRTERGVS